MPWIPSPQFYSWVDKSQEDKQSLQEQVSLEPYAIILLLPPYHTLLSYYKTYENVIFKLQILQTNVSCKVQVTTNSP